jgi:hypothetical protein
MQNRVSADVASKRLSKLLVESTDIPIPDLAQIPPSLAATQIFSLSKFCSFLPFFLLYPCFLRCGHSTASQPYICVRVTVLSTEFEMFVLHASPWLAPFLFVALALLYLSYNFNSDVLRFLQYALSLPRANLPIPRYALLCSTLSIAVKPKLPSLHLTVGHYRDHCDHL